MDTDQLMEFIRDEFESDCAPNKKRLFNKNKNVSNEDGDGKPAAAQETDDQAARANP